MHKTVPVVLIYGNRTLVYYLPRYSGCNFTTATAINIALLSYRHGSTAGLATIQQFSRYFGHYYRGFDHGYRSITAFLITASVANMDILHVPPTCMTLLWG